MSLLNHTVLVYDDILEVFALSILHEYKMERGKLICIEGLDGVGKTTCVQHLADKLNATIMKTPPKEILNIRERCANTTNPNLRYHYYLLGNYLVSEDIEILLNNGKNVILDRFYASTMAYMWGFEKLPFSNTEWPPGLLRPDYMFLLNLPREARLHRLESRTNIAKTDEEKILHVSPDIEQRIIGYFLKFGCIDLLITENLTTDEICDKIIKCIS